MNNALSIAIQNNELSLTSNEIAKKRNLADFVEQALNLFDRFSTKRNYSRNFAQFIRFVCSEYGIENSVTEHKQGHKKLYEINPELDCRLFALVTPSLFMQFEQEFGHAAYGAKTLLSIAYLDNILPDKEARKLDVKPFKLKKSRQSKITGRRLSSLEVQQLRIAIDDSLIGIRDKAIIDVMLFAGLRRNEVCELNLTNFHLDNGRWHIIFAGKGKKTRKIALHSELFKSVNDWLKVYNHSFGDDVPLFVNIGKGSNLGDNRLSGSALGEMIAKLGHKSNLAPLSGNDRLSCHDLRRTFARRCYDCGMSVESIRILLGHSDLATTQKYLGLSQDDANKSIDMLNYQN